MTVKSFRFCFSSVIKICGEKHENPLNGEGQHVLGYQVHMAELVSGRTIATSMHRQQTPQPLPLDVTLTHPAPIFKLPLIRPATVYINVAVKLCQPQSIWVGCFSAKRAGWE